MKLNPNAFKLKYGDAVIKSTRGTKILPSVKLAQMAIETGWGDKILNNNVFGIKADSAWPGKVQSFTTQEVKNGVRKTYKGTGKVYQNRKEALSDGALAETLFRFYNSLEDSIADHSRFLIENPRYSKVLEAETPEVQAQELENAGYATGRNYNETIMSIINNYNFRELDIKKKQMMRY